ncbi:MAG TPA: prepilin-type N-terminal cleavage/methylation domain-containing protein [Stenotrophomonas sp.]|nr:prepilin-type N-terminal cleavage/methylation domain-containing protein [Stenotrophomonas sp.]
MSAQRNAARGQRGWSLLELSVVLAVLGLLGLVLWRLLPLAPQVAAADAAGRDLAQAEQALVGYALVHHRLPAPVSVGGLAMLPVQELGLPARLQLRYQVQPTLTQAPFNRYEPVLPPAAEGSAPSTSNQVNGLDLCMALKAVADTSLSGMQDIPTALALMHRGGVGNERTPDDFVLPGSVDAGSRRVLAVGPNELASRLQCPDRVARTQGAARAANAAYDMARVARRYKDFRTFGIQVAEMNLQQAKANEVFAGFDVAYGVALEAIAILQEAAGWPPDALGIATGIAAHVTATAQLAIAIYNLDQAVKERKEAEAGLQTAKDQETAAIATVSRMDRLASQSLQRALQLDAAGLQP